MHFFFTLLLSLMVSAPSMTSSMEENSRSFPEYDTSLDLDFYDSCEANCMFTSCSMTICPGTCSCTCGLLSCECTCTIGSVDQTSITSPSNTPISVQKEQYANWEELGALLGRFGNGQAQVAQHELIGMIGYLIKKDYSAYRVASTDLLNHLKALPVEEKAMINAFLKSNGSDFGV